MNDAAADYHHGHQDVTEQVASYRAFGVLSKYGSLALGVLVLMLTLWFCVGAGLLATAGGLLFAADGSGNFMALDSRDGKPLWHTRIGNASNAPETYLVDGRQDVLIAVGDTLYAFTLY